MSAQALFEDIPPPVRAFLATGYSQLAALLPATLDDIASRVSRWLDPRYPYPTAATVATDLAVDVESMDHVISAVTFQATTLFSPTRSLSMDVFLSGASAAGVLATEHAAAARGFAERLNHHRSEIQEALTRAQSSTEIVPSFGNLETVIDFRVSAVNGSRLVVTPMALAVLQTDVPSKYLVFQMTPRDVHKIRQGLESLTEQFRTYENMAVVPDPKRG